MKRILGLLLTLGIAASLILSVMPVSAADITTEVTVSSGGGSVPLVKVKWEQEPITSLESGDPTHLTPLTQVNPPLVKNAQKQICYYAVVTDQEDMGSVSQVFADVYHPLGSPAPYSTSSDPRGPLFKYEIPFAKVGHALAQQNLVTAASNAGLLTFSGNLTLSEIIFEMDKGTADLWKGCAMIDYEQPAGNYDVNVYAVDSNNNLSAVLHNQFLYVPICGVEVDFTGIVYGPVNLGVEKMVAGDIRPFVSPAALAGFGQTNLATVRNVGNTWAHVKVTESDMGFGKDVTGMWNVKFDARMGSNNAYKVTFDPEQTVTLPNYLALSSQDELDFSIKVLKGFGTHSGTITIGCAIEPFTSPAPVINGP